MSITALRASILALALLGGSAAQANEWDWSHPRRAEVNARLDHQQDRIVDGLHDGELSAGQAHRLHEEDAAVRLEERADAAVNGGHITRGEQRTINVQEDAVSRQIHFDRTY
jgi:hypothetical protein